MKASSDIFMDIMLKSIFSACEENQDIKDLQIVLRRLLANETLQLIDLQIARDVVEGACIPIVEYPAAYLFLAAMLISWHDGNAFMNKGDSESLLIRGCYKTEDQEGNNACSAVIRRLLNVGVADSITDNFVVLEGEHCYFRRDCNSARNLGDKLSALIAAADNAVSQDILDHAMDFQFPNGKTLNEEQKQAVEAAVANRFMVITGGPGTGKTTIVCAILRALLGAKVVNANDIGLVAPTGRAAQRMGEALKAQCINAHWNADECELRTTIENMTGSTIHSLLGGYKPDFKHNADNRLHHKLLIVDESSMVDIELMNALVSAMSDDCRLILLGDKDQLPSVESGAVLGDIVTNARQNIIVMLTESCRFSGKLKECARAINVGDCQAATGQDIKIDGEENSWTDLAKQDDCTFRWYESKPGNPEQVHEIINLWQKSNDYKNLLQLAKSFPEDDGSITVGCRTDKSSELFKALAKTQILTVVREGKLGVSGINEMLLKAHTGKTNVQTALSQCAGIPVIVTHNTRARNLFNGDMGITVMTSDGMVALFPCGEKVIKCPITLLPEHDLAYAITVHKSQGSEYDRVLVVLPDDPQNPLLCRQLLYTGITRAKKCSVIIGTNDAYRQAINYRLTRNSGIVLN